MPVPARGGPPRRHRHLRLVAASEPRLLGAPAGPRRDPVLTLGENSFVVEIRSVLMEVQIFDCYLVMSYLYFDAADKRVMEVSKAR